MDFVAAVAEFAVVVALVAEFVAVVAAVALVPLLAEVAQALVDIAVPVRPDLLHPVNMLKELLGE